MKNHSRSRFSTHHSLCVAHLYNSTYRLYHTESLTNTIGKWSIGIGSYDINDKCYYTNEPHKGYDVWKNENGYGFSFILLDRSVKKITFLVAWIEKLPDSNINFEDALDFWLT